MILALVVEGHGEVEAVPVLLRRMISWMAPGVAIEIPRPYRVKRQQIVKEGELEKVVRFMGAKAGGGGGVLVVLDADDDCAATLGPALLRRAQVAFPGGNMGLVLAEREFESWFLAGATSLRGHRSLPYDLAAPVDPERIRGAKEWLADKMPFGYSETLDQSAFAAVVDLGMARRALSFDKLVRDLSRLLGVPTPERDA